MIKYHIILGYSFFVSTFAHMICWWVVYYRMGPGKLAHDIFHVPMYYPRNGAEDPTAPQSDNFTIQLSTMGFWISILVIFVPTFFRRKNFQVFYYLHYFFIPLILIIMLHAASVFYFVFPGVLLYGLDRTLRIIRESSVFEVSETSP